MHQAAGGVILPAVGQIIAAVDRPEVARREPSSRGAELCPIIGIRKPLLRGSFSSEW